MIRKWSCLLLALMLIFGSFDGTLAEDIVVEEDTEYDADVVEVSGDLNSLAVFEESPEQEPEAFVSEAEADLAVEPNGAESGEVTVAEENVETAGTEDEDEQEKGPRLTLSASRLTIGVGEKCTILKATVTPADKGEMVTWASNKTRVAVVNSTTGVITGKKSGTASKSTSFLVRS